MKTLPLLLTLTLAAAAGTALAHGAAPADEHGSRHGETAGMRDMVKTAFGQTGDPKQASRTIQVEMVDTMRFTPAAITVQQGETVRFVVRNAGKVMHEMVLGTDENLRKHAEMMRKHPGMEHDEPFMTHVAPSKRGELVWQFTEAGDFKFACLIPGHFEAGMVGTIRVVKR